MQNSDNFLSSRHENPKIYTIPLKIKIIFGYLKIYKNDKDLNSGASKSALNEFVGDDERKTLETEISSVHLNHFC